MEWVQDLGQLADRGLGLPMAGVDLMRSQDVDIAAANDPS